MTFIEPKAYSVQWLPLLHIASRHFWNINISLGRVQLGNTFIVILMIQFIFFLDNYVLSVNRLPLTIDGLISSQAVVYQQQHTAVRYSPNRGRAFTCGPEQAPPSFPPLTADGLLTATSCTYSHVAIDNLNNVIMISILWAHLYTCYADQTSCMLVNPSYSSTGNMIKFMSSLPNQILSLKGHLKLFMCVP